MNKILSDRYLLVKSLGEGGMADVYLAMDTILSREVAIKILRGELSSDPVTLLRFQREAAPVAPGAAFSFPRPQSTMSLIPCSS